MINIGLRFDVSQKVWIKELELYGVILSCWYNQRYIKYEVRFCTNGEYKTEYLFEFELLESKP